MTGRYGHIIYVLKASTRERDVYRNIHPVTPFRLTMLTVLQLMIRLKGRVRRKLRQTVKLVLTS